MITQIKTLTRKFVKKVKGLTLLEMVISIGIFVLVATAISIIFNRSLVVYRATTAKNAAAQEAQAAAEWLVREIQSASKIKEANSDNLTLINPDAEEINYYLDVEQTIHRQVSTDPAYLLAEGITKFNFNYYDINNQELSAPVTDTNLIKLVELELAVQKGKEEFQLNTVARCELWMSGYSYRKEITVQSAYINSDLTDFPLYVNITSDSDIGAHMQDTFNYYDIRFTDLNNNILPYEQESMEISGGVANGHYWVKTDLDSSSGATLYCYYGKSEDADGSNASGVWSANYVGAWHMNEDSWNGTSGEVKDSTSYNNDGTRADNANTIPSGKIGRCGTFDGTNDQVVVPDPADNSLDLTGNFTISFWYKLASSPVLNWNVMVSKGDSTSLGDNNYSCAYNRDSDYLRIKGNFGANDYNFTQDTSWHYAVFTVDGTDVCDYVDVLNGDCAGQTTSPSAVSAPLRIGAVTATGKEYTGYLDEVRIATDVRTAAEIKFEYYNMNEPDNELTWVAEEAK